MNNCIFDSSLMKQLINALVIFFLLAGAATDLSAQAPNSRNQITTCPLYVPNAFTPNGDDLNERFTVKHSEDCEMLSYNIKIFDRWGQLVFESDDASFSRSWDGTLDGKPVQQGVYMYKISAKLVNYNLQSEASLANRQGSLVLIR